MEQMQPQERPKVITDYPKQDLRMLKRVGAAVGITLLTAGGVLAAHEGIQGHREKQAEQADDVAFSNLQFDLGYDQLEADWQEPVINEDNQLEVDYSVYAEDKPWMQAADPANIKILGDRSDIWASALNEDGDRIRLTGEITDIESEVPTPRDQKRVTFDIPESLNGQDTKIALNNVIEIDMVGLQSGQQRTLRFDQPPEFIEIEWHDGKPIIVEHEETEEVAPPKGAEDGTVPELPPQPPSKDFNEQPAKEVSSELNEDHIKK